MLQHELIKHSSASGSRSVSTIAGGLNLAMEALIERSYKEAIRCMVPG
jgi:hypothetical protein